MKPDSGKTNIFIPPPIMEKYELENTVRIAAEIEQVPKGIQVKDLRILAS